MSPRVTAAELVREGRGRTAAEHHMDRKRLLRSPLVWIVVVLVVYLAYSYLSDDTRGYTQQTTSVALTQLSDGNVASAIIDDKEQRLRLTLKNPVDGADKIYAQYPADSADDVFTAVQNAKVENYDIVVTSESALFSLLHLPGPGRTRSSCSCSG